MRTLKLAPPPDYAIKGFPLSRVQPFRGNGCSVCGCPCRQVAPTRRLRAHLPTFTNAVPILSHPRESAKMLSVLIYAGAGYHSSSTSAELKSLCRAACKEVN